MRLLFKILCKAFELILRITSSVRLGFKSPVDRLLDFETTAQKAAYFDEPSLAARASIVNNPSRQAATEKELSSKRLIVVIPYRDEWNVTARCLKGLAEQQGLDHMKVEVWLIDNGSIQVATAEGQKASILQKWPAWLEVIHRTYPGPFNFSSINNWAVKEARKTADSVHYPPKGSASAIQSGEPLASTKDRDPWLLLLNNDIEFVSNTSVSSLLNTASQLPRLGGLGVRLNYPNGRLQHLFAAPGVKIVAGHPLRGTKVPSHATYLTRSRPVAAVTAAVLLMRSQVFDQLDGFDERLSTVGQDIDLCLRMQKIGLTAWVEPRIVLIHHESLSRRGKTIDRHQVDYLYEKWGDYLLANPFYSERFSRWSEYPSLTLGEGRYPWWRLLKSRS